MQPDNNPNQRMATAVALIPQPFRFKTWQRSWQQQEMQPREKLRRATLQHEEQNLAVDLAAASYSHSRSCTSGRCMSCSTCKASIYREAGYTANLSLTFNPGPPPYSLGPKNINRTLLHPYSVNHLWGGVLEAWGGVGQQPRGAAGNSKVYR